MNISDRQSLISGSVRPFVVSTDGKIVDLGGKCNTILNSGHRLLAKLMAGDPKYFPSGIAFVCTNSENGTLEHQISPEATYEDLIDGGRALVSPFAAGSKVDSNRPAVTFTSHTGMTNSDWSGTVYIKRAILLSDDPSLPFSAVDFDSSFEISRNGSFHFGMYWTIAFGPESDPA